MINTMQAQFGIKTQDAIVRKQMERFDLTERQRIAKSRGRYRLRKMLADLRKQRGVQGEWGKLFVFLVFLI